MKDVRIEGNRRVEQAAIRSAIGVKKDAPYDPKQVGRDVKALMKLGMFSDVTVAMEGVTRMRKI